MVGKCVRALCVMLAVVLSPLLNTAARASISYRDAEAPEVYANAYGVSVYDEPDTKSKVLEIVPFARNLKRVLVRKGWAKVYTVNRVLGYCKDEYLTTTNPNTYNRTMFCQQAKAPVYRRPNINSEILGHLRMDEEIMVRAMTPLGDWLRIEQGGHFGYIQRPRMDTERYAKGRPAWCSEGSMDVYYDPALDTKLGTLYFGQSFTLVSRQGSRAKIRSAGGYIGYCDPNAITTTNPNNINATVYTQADGNFMFKSSTDLSGRVQVDKNEMMTLLAVDGNRFWARVEYNGENYYIPYVFLGPEKRVKDYKKVVARAGVNIREGTKKSSAIVATVPTGAEMWLIGATDNRAKVTTLPDGNGKTYTGYVELQYLK